MAFKSYAKYQEDKNGDFFVLPNDGDFADVVFLYQSTDDVLVGDVHWIQSSEYKGYVHCLGSGCPACNYKTRSGRGIRIDQKLFIPLYNITKNKIEFWDKTPFFESILEQSVFRSYPNPSETVFRITRRGEAGSRDTRYQIDAIGRNSAKPYSAILSEFGITLPEGYSIICKEMDATKMSAVLNSTGSSSDNLDDYGYVPVPRGQDSSVAAPTTPEIAPPIINDSPSVADDLPVTSEEAYTDDIDDNDVKF